MPKKPQQPIMLQQYLISIDARLQSRNSTVSAKANTAECLVARKKVWNLQKAFSLRTIKVFRFEVIDVLDMFIA